MEKEIERQVGIIMGLFWDSVILMEIERRRRRQERKKRRSNRIVIPNLIGVGKLEIMQLARVFGQNPKFNIKLTRRTGRE